MKKEMLSTSQMRSLSSIVRLAIVASLRANGAQSIAGLADSLGAGAKGLYYHIRHLEGAGLVRVKSVRSTSRREEAVYEAVGQVFGIENRGESTIHSDAWRLFVRTVLRQSVRLWEKAVDAARDGRLRPEHFLVETINVRLSSGDIEELRVKLDEVRAWALKRNRPNGETRVSYTFLGCPVPASGDTSQHGVF